MLLHLIEMAIFILLTFAFLEVNVEQMALTVILLHLWVRVVKCPEGHISFDILHVSNFTF